MSEFRDFLADWLDERGWSANRLADETGIAQTLISRYLSLDPHKRVIPADQTLRRLAPIVGKSHDELMRMVGRLDEPSEPAPLKDDELEWLALLRLVPDVDRLTVKTIVRKFAVHGSPPRHNGRRSQLHKRPDDTLPRRNTGDDEDDTQLNPGLTAPLHAFSQFAGSLIRPVWRQLLVS